MGFMLIQCALGAYLAAVIHLILHGLFKATLFLQAGSSVQRFDGVKQSNEKDVQFMDDSRTCFRIIYSNCFLVYDF